MEGNSVGFFILNMWYKGKLPRYMGVLGSYHDQHPLIVLSSMNVKRGFGALPNSLLPRLIENNLDFYTNVRKPL